jgi:hypothetical protein
MLKGLRRIFAWKDSTQQSAISSQPRTKPLTAEDAEERRGNNENLCWHHQRSQESALLRARQTQQEIFRCSGQRGLPVLLLLCFLLRSSAPSGSSAVNGFG